MMREKIRVTCQQAVCFSTGQLSVTAGIVVDVTNGRRLWQRIASPTTVNYFTARDAFRTDSEFRTDLAATLNHSLGVGEHKLDLFAQAQVLNIFNQFQLCGCGAAVFANGGNVQLNLISTAVNSPNGTTRPNFNPFTQAPVQGVNWDFAPGFGTASSRMAFTMPREFRLTFGVRF